MQKVSTKQKQTYNKQNLSFCGSNFVKGKFIQNDCVIFDIYIISREIAKLHNLK